MAKTKNIPIYFLSLFLTLGAACGGNVNTEPQEAVRASDTLWATVYVYDTIVEPVRVPESAAACASRVFEGEVGVLEQGANNHGQRIGEYLAVTNLGQGYAYCAAFICWGFEQCQVPHPASAWSPTVALYNVVYRRGDELPYDNGMLVGSLYYKNLGRIGHVFKLVEFRGEEMVTIEGNTNGQGSREGDGVHRKIRPVWAAYTFSDYGA